MEDHAPVQRDSDFQTEMFQMKEEFETNSRCYDGNDPLNLWYEYILKVEDCHIRNGNVVSVIPLLENCLQLFETDTRYSNDRRYCKLWIKYIDLQKNIDLFKELHSKSICIKCTDFYRAWALYHELTGDFKQANAIFEMGKRSFAEPAEELDIAQKKLVFMAGLHLIFGPDELRLYERKKELYSLHRIKYHNQHTFYNACQINTQGLPVFDVRYLTNSTDSINSSGTALKPEDSVITKVEQKVVTYEGIRLYADFAPVNHDDYSTWEVDLCIPDPDLPDKRCMYEKHDVYKDGTEYSPEEIKARRYFIKKKELSETDQHMATETIQAVESIVNNDKNIIPQEDNFAQESTSYIPNASCQEYSKFLGFTPQPQSQRINEKGDATSIAQTSSSDNKTQSWQNNTKVGDNTTFMKDLWKDDSHVSVQKPSYESFQIHEDTKLLRDETVKHNITPQKNIKTPFMEKQFVPERNQIVQQLFGDLSDQENMKIITPTRTTNQFQNQPFLSPSQNFVVSPDPRVINKPTPRQYLSQPLPDNSRDQMKHFSQPTEFQRPAEVQKPAAKQFRIFDDEPSTILNESNLNTQVFNFNLPLSSTPFNQKKIILEAKNDEELKINKQKLFEEENHEEKWSEQQNQNKLSTIFEQTKELCSSSSNSSSGQNTFKTQTFNNLKTIPESIIENSNSKIYVQSPYQINRTHVDQSYLVNDQRTNNEASYRLYSQNEVPHIQTEQLEPSFQINQNEIALLGVEPLKTPSPQKNFSQSYISQSLYNHTLNNQSKINYSNVIREEQHSTQMKRQQMDQSCIYIDDTNNVESPNKMQFADINSPYQSQQYNAKLQRDRKLERERFESKNAEGTFYDGSNDSNSLKYLWGRSPAKGSRMDIDVIKDVMSQNSNPDLRMDYDSCPEPPVDESILLRTPSDPFSSKITKALLKKIGFPQQRHQMNYVTLQKLPRLVTKDTVVIADERYMLGQVIGKGAYGQVFKATRLSTNELVALKFQRPMNQWEFYICKEIEFRSRNPHFLKAFMSIDVGYFCPSSSILVSEFCRYGSLLDLSNKVKQTTGKGLKELVVIYFANEIITIINALHECQIIHADIKPDNFLVTRMPPEWGHPCIQLIDFGCSIDMRLFPKGQTFTKVVNTENFTCPEMKDGRPWSYQTDLFCSAATVHVLLFEKYLQLQKKGAIWSISTRVPRYMRSDLWNTFFFQMLNIENCDKLPDLQMIKRSFETIISEQGDELQMDMRNIGNSVNGR